jgi:hypothetical protein
MDDEFAKTVLPALNTFLEVLITAALAWAVSWLKCWVKKQNEKVDQDSLHRALDTGTKVGMDVLGPGASPSEIASFAKEYTQQSVPEALKNLNPPDDVLEQIARSKQVDNKGVSP